MDEMLVALACTAASAAGICFGLLRGASQEFGARSLFCGIVLTIAVIVGGPSHFLSSIEYAPLRHAFHYLPYVTLILSGALSALLAPYVHKFIRLLFRPSEERI